MSSNTTATETCACGATFTITAWPPYVVRELKDWREGHRHAESVGICGDKAPLIIPDGSDIAPMYCDLKAGHDGAHSDGQSHWSRTEGAESDTTASVSDSRGQVDSGTSRDVKGAQRGAQRFEGDA
jgi:hypothetical protein